MTKRILCLLIAAVMTIGLTACNLKGDTGERGADGKNGLTPYIGANGNWFIGDEDTGVCAQGNAGSNGAKGDKGDTGATGATGANGTDGITPHIGENGNWFIGDQDTGIKAQGAKGDKGDTGATGVGIAKAEIVNGELILTYTNGVVDNLGKIVVEVANEQALDFYPLPDGTYGVMAGKSRYLERIEIPATYNGRAVTQILAGAFTGAENLKEIIIPSSVTCIDSYAFALCPSLTSVNIPFGVTTIGAYAFTLCPSLASITVPNSVTSISQYAFYECNALKSITLPFTGSGNGAYTHLGYIFGAPSYSTNPNYVPASLTSVVITGGDRIDSYAFYGCKNLTGIVISSGVTTIGASAFSGCTALTQISIPHGVTSISGSAFYNCKSLTSITIPESVTSIGSSAFAGCESLTQIRIPDGVTSIGYYSTFANCKSLESITLPDGIACVGESMLAGCTALKSITLPRGVTSIGISAFEGCEGLTDVYYKGTASEWALVAIGINNNAFKSAVLHLSTT